MSTKESEQQLDMRTVELLYNFAKESFTNYLDTIDKLDQKIVTLISLDGLIISLIFRLGQITGIFFSISLFSLYLSQCYSES
jgi:hypothetical protein